MKSLSGPVSINQQLIMQDMTVQLLKLGKNICLRKELWEGHRFLQQQIVLMFVYTLTCLESGIMEPSV